jgi:hypothetical protein
MEESMEAGQPIEFVVGETYENEKGPFKVLSIERNTMVIEWESGESIETTVSFQRRIQERRRWERQMKEKKAAASSSKARGASGRKAGSTFEGFRLEDFKKAISRTPWRSRSQFGGAVTARLQSSRMNFNSWAAKRRNEVHWADSDHWKKKRVDYPAKFFARADEDTLAWGFYIERPEAGREPSPDWDRFIAWLRDDQNEHWLLNVAREQNLVVYDAHRRSFDGFIEPGDGQWHLNGDAAASSKLRLIELIDQCPSDTWFDLMIAKRIPKGEAIEKGRDMAVDVAALIGELFPLYEAAAVH